MQFEVIAEDDERLPRVRGGFDDITGQQSSVVLWPLQLRCDAPALAHWHRQALYHQDGPSLTGMPDGARAHMDNLDRSSTLFRTRSPNEGPPFATPGSVQAEGIVPLLSKLGVSSGQGKGMLDASLGNRINHAGEALVKGGSCRPFPVNMSSLHCEVSPAEFERFASKHCEVPLTVRTSRSQNSPGSSSVDLVKGGSCRPFPDQAALALGSAPASSAPATCQLVKGGSCRTFPAEEQWSNTQYGNLGNLQDLAPLHESAYAAPCVSELATAPLGGTGVRTCLRSSNKRTRNPKRVRFDFAVSFWFPAPSQLGLSRPLAVNPSVAPPGPDPAAPHDALSHNPLPFDAPHVVSSLPSFPVPVDILLPAPKPFGTVPSHEGPSILQSARRKPQSKQQAIRLGAEPYAAPPAHHPGLHRPLSFAGHVRVEEPGTLAEEGHVPNPYTSFDEVNGPIVLAGEAEWTTDQYVAHALTIANLPGNPLVRFMRFELVDFPGPQLALTQDHGAAHLRARVCDFRPLHGKVEVIDAAFTASVLDLIQASRSISDHTRALATVTGVSCTTVVNGVIVPPERILPQDADLILCRTWADGQPVNVWRPFVLGDARPPVPPIPDTDPMASTSGYATFVGATATRPAAIPRYGPAHIAPPPRYTYLDTLEGVQNRPKPADGSDQACLADALTAVPRRGTPLGARLIARPLTGLYLPQVLLTRVSHRTGWHTIAIDLRPIRLGINQQLSLDAEETALYTVFDVVHHFRILPRGLSDSHELLIAKAISVTPEVPEAEGHVLLHGIAELPMPQIVLAASNRPCCVVPLLYKLQPVSVCTSEVSQNAAAFEVAFRASLACRALTGASQQVARRTAAITGHSGSAEPFRPGCVRDHEALVLRGFTFGMPRPRIRGAGVPEWIEARQLDNREDPSLAELEMIRVYVARGRPGPLHIAPSASLRHVVDYITIQSPAGSAGTVRWPFMIPAMPGAVPLALHVTPEAADEAPHWALVDIRRVGHPPLLPFQTVPLPTIVDVASLLSILRHELPSLRPISGVYLDDQALSGIPRTTAAAMTVTVMGHRPDTPPEAQATPALDINLDLMERRTALCAHFNSFPPAPWPKRLASGSSRASFSSITEDHTDSSASFRSGSITEDLDPEPDLQLPLPPTTSTSTTLALASRPVDSDFAADPLVLGDFSCVNLTVAKDGTSTTSTTSTGCESTWPGGVMLSTTSTSTPPCHSPLLGFRQSEIAFHVMGTDSAVAHTTTSGRGHTADILAELTWCLHSNHALAPCCNVLANTRIFFDEANRAHVFFHLVPFGIPWDPQLEFATVLDQVGLSPGEVAIVSVDGEIRRDHPARASPGSVVVVSPTSYGHFTLPLHLLSYRCVGIQALLFCSKGPGIEQLSAKPATVAFCHALVRRARELLGEDLPGNKVLIAGTKSPPLLCCVGTPLPPSLHQVQCFYDERLACHFGPLCLRDTAQVHYDIGYYVEAPEECDRRIWLLPMEEGADCHYGDISGESLAGVATSRGLRLEASVMSGWVGLSCLQPATCSLEPAVHEIVRIPPGLSSDSEDGGSASQVRDLTSAEARLIALWKSRNTRLAHGEEVASHSSSSPEVQEEQRAVSFVSSSSSSSDSSSSSTPTSDAHGLASATAAPSLLQLSTGGSKVGDSSLIRRIPTPCRASACSRTPSLAAVKTSEDSKVSFVDNDDQQLEILLPHAEAVALHVPANCSFLEIDQALGLRLPGVRASSLVPVYPPGPHMQCVVAPGSEMKAVCVIVIQEKDGTARACEVLPHDTATDLIRKVGLSAVTIAVDGIPWIGTQQGCYTGMRLHAIPVVEITPHSAPGPSRAAVPLDPTPGPRLLTGMDDSMPCFVFEEFRLPALCQDCRCLGSLHPATVAALNVCPPWTGEPYTHVRIYTDGSFCPQTLSAAWAICVLLCCRGQWTFAGFASDGLYVNGQHYSLGQPHASAHVAELTAMAAAAALVGNLGRMRDGHVEICFDAIAAAGIAEGRQWSRTLESFSLGVTALMHLAQQRSGAVCWRHVRAHQIDSCGTAVIGECPTPDLAALDFSDRVPGSRGTHWSIRLVTYNCLSLGSVVQRDCLQRQFQGLGIHIIGFQETRRACEPCSSQGPFAVFASQPEAGQLGCQLWIARGIPLGHTVDGDPIFFDPSQACIFHASPRILMVLWSAGDTHLAFCVAHAHTSATPEEVQREWWQQLQSLTRRVPRKYQPFILVDANARLAPCSSGCITEAQCLNVPARFLLDLQQTQQLSVSGNVDAQGRTLHSWQSPTGYLACLDYLLVPQAFASGLWVHGNIDGFSDCFDFDHRPLLFCCAWTSVSCRSDLATRFDRRAMLSDAGRQTLRDIWRRAPQADWAEHADTYLHDVNQFVLAELKESFTLNPRRPRQMHISDSTWGHIRLLRRARRHLHSMNRANRLLQLRLIWNAWRGGQCPVSARAFFSLQLSIARGARVVRRVRLRQRQLLRHDEARFTRTCFQEARADGPEALARLLRGILKCGRSYKPARMAPALQTTHGLITGDRATASLCGEHFARAERSVPVDWHALTRPLASRETADVDLQQVPTLHELARAFSGLKHNKAPGLLGIPAEAYAAAPLESAEVHWPLLLRAACGREPPTLHKGGLVRAIPKPNKSPSDLSGWRNVLLQEPAAKAIGRTFRSRLVSQFLSRAHPAQCGAQRCVPLELPMAHVRAHLEYLASHRQSGGFLFIDAKDAYYSVVKHFLFADGLLDSPEQLEATIVGFTATNVVAVSWQPSWLGQACWTRRKLRSEIT